MKSQPAIGWCNLSSLYGATICHGLMMSKGDLWQDMTLHWLAYGIRTNGQLPRPIVLANQLSGRRRDQNETQMAHKWVIKRWLHRKRNECEQIVQ